MGPVISADAVADYRAGLAEIVRQGGQILSGGRVLTERGGYFVEPAIVRSRPDMPIVAEEIFAPILHVLEVDSLAEAIAVNNAVPQGLSSSLFTTDLRNAETWLSAVGSDCGLANVNVGTSGAEIGGAFGGEKMTVAVARPAPTRGRPICADRLARSTTAAAGWCWPRASRSTSAARPELAADRTGVRRERLAEQRAGAEPIDVEHTQIHVGAPVEQQVRHESAGRRTVLKAVA